MADLAELAFKADTTPLDKAAKSTEKLKTAAAGISPTMDKVARSIKSRSAASAAAIGMATKSTDALVRSMQGVASQQMRNSKASAQTVNNLRKVAAAQNSLKKSVDQTTLAFQKQKVQMETPARVPASVNPFGGRTQSQQPRDVMPNRFNTGNIAAQFQDIGVTAAMGMNPLTIALQQGTQLSAILNTMEKPLSGIAIAFKSVLNATSLLSIGIVALIATLVQLVDWTEFASKALTMLANGLDAVVPYALAAAAALALIYSPAIIAGLFTVTKTLLVLGATALKTGAMMAAAWALANPMTLIAGLVAAGAMISVWLVEKHQGFRDFVNGVIGLFVGLWKAIGKSFESANIFAFIGDVATKALGTVWNKVVDGVNVLLERIAPLAEKISFDIAPFKLDKMNLTEAEQGITDFASVIQKEFQDAATGVDYVGQISEFTTEKVKGLTDAMRGLADGMGETSKEYQSIKTKAEGRIKTLEAERMAIGMTAEAAARLKYETELLNQARQKGIELTPAQTKELKELAGEMANADAALQKTKDNFNLARSAGKSFFSEMKSALVEGKSLWESFGNGVVNVLTKILDKMLDVGIDFLFAGAKSGGFLDFLTPSAGAAVPNAKGNAFGSSGIKKFAKGGEFTNTIQSSPTLFAFANGGSFGMMGEAGPEAVMPLERGSDGSLGVRAYGSNDNAANVNVNVINNTSAQANVQQRQTANGVELDVIIDDAVSEKIGQQGTSTNRALNVYNSRQLTRR